MKKSESQSYAAKIEDMKAGGKISEQQALILEEAFSHSEKRRELLYKQIKEQKLKRERRTLGLLGVGLAGIFFMLSLAVMIGGRQGVSRDIKSALVQLDQAGLALSRGDLDEARKRSQLAITKSSRFSLAYAMKGLALQQQFEKTGEAQYKDEAAEAFSKAQQYFEEGRGSKMTGAAFFFFLLFLLFVLTIVCVVFLILHNILVQREENVNESWAQIGVFLQRKIDLIPALLQAAEGYAGHEKSTLEEVISARNEAGKDLAGIEGTGADKKEQLELMNHIQQLISNGLSRIKALVEMYPDLKANQNYLTLQDQIEEVEKSIALARQKFNKRVKAYNVSLRQFPFNLLASAGRFQTKQYFETPAE
ncbi:MAG: LemA family protein [Candidatus Omnitrophota bacterium]